MSVNIHATCLRLGRAGAPFGAPPTTGILLLGSSGAGKSDLALRLIALGALLVADDRTDLYVSRGRLHGRAPARIGGLLEIRNIGIVALPHAAQAHIGLVAELGDAAPRMPQHRRYRPPAALRLTADAAPPLISIAPFECSAPAKIAAAAAAYAKGLHREAVNHT